MSMIIKDRNNHFNDHKNKINYSNDHERIKSNHVNDPFFHLTLILLRLSNSHMATM
jgi:hypothetical protein